MKSPLIGIFIAWFALCLIPDGRTQATDHHPREKIFLSRTCTDSHWQLDDSDDISATLVCYAVIEDEGEN